MLLTVILRYKVEECVVYIGWPALPLLPSYSIHYLCVDEIVSPRYSGAQVVSLSDTCRYCSRQSSPYPMLLPSRSVMRREECVAVSIDENCRQTAIDYVSRGIVNLKPLVSNRFAFEEYDDAYKYIDSHRETSMKVIVDLEQKPAK